MDWPLFNIFTMVLAASQGASVQEGNRPSIPPTEGNFPSVQDVHRWIRIQSCSIGFSWSDRFSIAINKAVTAYGISLSHPESSDKIISAILHQTNFLHHEMVGVLPANHYWGKLEALVGPQKWPYQLLNFTLETPVLLSGSEASSHPKISDRSFTSELKDVKSGIILQWQESPFIVGDPSLPIEERTPAIYVLKFWEGLSVIRQQIFEAQTVKNRFFSSNQVLELEIDGLPLDKVFKVTLEGRIRMNLQGIVLSFTLDTGSLIAEEEVRTTGGVQGCYSALQVRCPNSDRCVSPYWICDGSLDCPDGADEEGCEEPSKCEEGFRCYGSKACLPLIWKCDGIEDCPDGEDEYGCSNCEGNDLMRCSSGSDCVSIGYACDGQKQCPDGWDETEALCKEHFQTLFGAAKACTNGTVPCGRSKRCVKMSSLCDHEEQCSEGEDEQEMVCSFKNYYQEKLQIRQLAEDTLQRQQEQIQKDLVQKEELIQREMQQKNELIQELSQKEELIKEQLLLIEQQQNELQILQKKNQEMQTLSQKQKEEFEVRETSTQLSKPVEEPITLAFTSTQTTTESIKTTPYSTSTEIQIPAVTTTPSTTTTKSAPSSTAFMFEEPLGQTTSCRTDEFDCGDGWCVPIFWLCDGRLDCLNGEDEEPKTCAAFLDGIDDGIADYTEHETQMENHCLEEESQCLSGDCISNELLCDGFYNCPDGDDEEDLKCLTTILNESPTTKPEKEYAFTNSSEAETTSTSDILIFTDSTTRSTTDSIAHPDNITVTYNSTYLSHKSVSLEEYSNSTSLATNDSTISTFESEGSLMANISDELETNPTFSQEVSVLNEQSKYDNNTLPLVELHTNSSLEEIAKSMSILEEDGTDSSSIDKATTDSSLLGAFTTILSSFLGLKSINSSGGLNVSSFLGLKSTNFLEGPTFSSSLGPKSTNSPEGSSSILPAITTNISLTTSTYNKTNVSESYFELPVFNSENSQSTFEISVNDSSLDIPEASNNEHTFVEPYDLILNNLGHFDIAMSELEFVKDKNETNRFTHSDYAEKPTTSNITSTFGGNFSLTEFDEQNSGDDPTTNLTSLEGKSKTSSNLSLLISANDSLKAFEEQDSAEDSTSNFTSLDRKSNHTMDYPIDYDALLSYIEDLFISDDFNETEKTNSSEVDSSLSLDENHIETDFDDCIDCELVFEAYELDPIPSNTKEAPPLQNTTSILYTNSTESNTTNVNSTVSMDYAINATQNYFSEFTEIVMDYDKTPINETKEFLQETNATDTNTTSPISDIQEDKNISNVETTDIPKNNCFIQINTSTPQISDGAQKDALYGDNITFTISGTTSDDGFLVLSTSSPKEPHAGNSTVLIAIHAGDLNGTIPDYVIHSTDGKRYDYDVIQVIDQPLQRSRNESTMIEGKKSPFLLEKVITFRLESNGKLQFKQNTLAEPDTFIPETKLSIKNNCTQEASTSDVGQNLNDTDAGNITSTSSLQPKYNDTDYGLVLNQSEKNKPNLSNDSDYITNNQETIVNATSFISINDEFIWSLNNNESESLNTESNTKVLYNETEKAEAFTTIPSLTKVENVISDNTDKVKLNSETSSHNSISVTSLESEESVENEELKVDEKSTKLKYLDSAATKDFDLNTIVEYPEEYTDRKMARDHFTEEEEVNINRIGLNDQGIQNPSSLDYQSSNDDPNNGEDHFYDENEIPNELTLNDIDSPYYYDMGNDLNSIGNFEDSNLIEPISADTINRDFIRSFDPSKSFSRSRHEFLNIVPCMFVIVNTLLIWHWHI